MTILQLLNAVTTGLNIGGLVAIGFGAYNNRKWAKLLRQWSNILKESERTLILMSMNLDAKARVLGIISSDFNEEPPEAPKQH